MKGIKHAQFFFILYLIYTTLCPWYNTGLESSPNNWVSFGKPSSHIGFPPRLEFCHMCLLISFSRGKNSVMVTLMHVKFHWKVHKNSFPMVYDTPIWFHATRTRFPSETLFQDLGFPHHFWVSRKSGNPVISSPEFLNNYRKNMGLPCKEKFHIFTLFANVCHQIGPMHQVLNSALIKG